MIRRRNPSPTRASHSASDASEDEFDSSPSWIKRLAPLGATLLLALALVVLMPPFTGPDEAGHMGYVVALAQGHFPLLPSSQSVDLNTGLTFQAQHPPLFYALAAPFLVVLGHNLIPGLYATRLVSVACLLLGVWASGQSAGLLLPPRAARWAWWLIATNPVLIYVCSVINNESLAIALGSVCVWLALLFRRTGSARFLVWAMIVGGLGLLGKLTALGPVLAAACIAGGALPLAFERVAAPKRASLWAGLALLLGAVCLYMPWNAVMWHLHGTLAPKLFHPLFVNGGFGAILLYPGDALQSAVTTLGEFAAGLLLPMWLMHGPKWESWVVAGGCLVALGIAWMSLRSSWKFVAAAFFSVYGMILMQAYFRDYDAVTGASRYVPVATPLVCMMVAERAQKLAPLARTIAFALWGCLVATMFVYLLRFFL